MCGVSLQDTCVVNSAHRGEQDNALAFRSNLTGQTFSADAIQLAAVCGTSPRQGMF